MQLAGYLSYLVANVWLDNTLPAKDHIISESGKHALFMDQFYNIIYLGNNRNDRKADKTSYLSFFLHQAENFDKYDKYWCKYEAWSGSPKVPAAEDHQAWNNTTETQRGQITFRDHVKKRMPQISLHACAYFGFLNVEDSFE